MLDDLAALREAIPKGVWRHFKGNLYAVVDIARHSETREPVVVYRALYGERELWVRPAAMWLEEVEREGERHRRFTFTGKTDLSEEQL